MQELLVAAPSMTVTELRKALDERKVDHSDCSDADAMRQRLLSALLNQARNEEKPWPCSMFRVPRAGIALSPAWTGLTKEALCLVPAWDFEHACRQNVANVDLTSVRTSIADFFARDRRELLQSDQDVANVCFDALIALICNADGARLVPPAEAQADNGHFHVPYLIYESPVPSTWRPDAEQMRLAGASAQETAEVEAAVADVRRRLGEPERLGPPNEVLELSTKADIEEQVVAYSKRPPPEGGPVIFFVRAAGCVASAHLDAKLEEAVRAHPTALRLAKVDVEMVAEIIPAFGEGGTHKVLSVCGGKFVSGFEGVPSEEELREFLRSVSSY